MMQTVKSQPLKYTPKTGVYFGILLVIFWLCPPELLAVSELSTKFNIYVPPNNKNNGKAVILTVTAYQNNTQVNIVDHDEDGDSDDSFSNLPLDEGQTFILYFQENGVNDDALGKWDGDYFTITSNHPVSVMQATTSTYQHDWLPSENKMMRGTKFIFYNPPSGGSPNEINLFSYTDSTDIAIYDITDVPLLGSGTTSVQTKNTAFITIRLNQGEDLLTIKQIGQNQFEAGHTYLVEATKPVTAQFGALDEEVRDGGGFVPSANGSAVGDLFYFTVPGEPDKKEIRILSFENNAEIQLFGWKDGWELIQTFILNQLDHGDWVSQYEGYELFKAISVTGENISIFESNWLETSDEPGTADITTFAASESGHGAGTRFVCYMPPPGDQVNVAGQGTRFSHLFLYGHYPNTSVRIYDTDSQGSKLNQTFNLQRDKFIDFKLSTNTYNTIYNGDGKPGSGPERPYLTVVSDQRIAVMISDWNDNWIAFGASVLLPVPRLSYSANPSFIDRPGQATFTGSLTNFGDTPLENCVATVTLPNGLAYLSSTWERGGNINVTSDPLTGETRLTWTEFQMAISDEIPFSITVNISDLSKSKVSGLGNTFTSKVVAGGYAENDFYETSDRAAIYVVNKIPLLPPTTVNATCLNGAIQLTWQPSASEKIIGYYLYRSLNSSGGFVRALPAILTDTSYVDYQVISTNYYYYYLTAINSALKESEPSLIASASPVCEEPVLQAPVLLRADPDSVRKTIDLTWTIARQNQLAGFWLYRSVTPGSGYTRLRQFAPTDTSHADTTVLYNHLYYYVVTAFDSAFAETDFSNALPAQIEQRPAPVLLSAVPDSASKSIHLTWTISSRFSVMAFSLYRRENSTGSYERVAFLPVSDTTFVDYSVEYNQSYFYIVRANYLTGGQSLASNELNASIYSIPTPVLLQVVPNLASQSLKLIWTINQRALISGFKIYRRQSTNAPYDFLFQQVAADTVYTDFRVELETDYLYSVRAFDNQHESPRSNELSGRLSQNIVPEVSLLKVLPDSLTQSMTLLWRATELPEINQFNIYRSQTPGGPYSKIGQVTAPDSTYRDRPVAFNTLYYYVVTALTKKSLETGYSNELSGSIFYLPTPELIQVVADSETVAIEVKWQVASPELVAGFILLRRPEAGEFSVIDEPAAGQRIFGDTEVIPGIRYYYQIRCFDIRRNLSRLSNILSARLEVPQLPETVFAYPNPCAEKNCQEIHFRFSLKENSAAKIDIYDLAGDFIHQLTGQGVAGEWNEVVWDISRIASDVYLFVFQANNYARGYEFKSIQKIAIIK